MNVRDSKLYCLGKEIEHDNIIAYDTNHIGCLYLTDDGRIHCVGALPWSRTKNSYHTGALDVYLSIDNSYIIVFKDRFEYYQVGLDVARVFNVCIKPDFRIFITNVHSNFCYINDGNVYTSRGEFVCQVPDCKFVWKIFCWGYGISPRITICIEYISLNDQCISQLYYAISGVYEPGSVTIENVTKLVDDDNIKVYRKDHTAIMYCCSTDYSIETPYDVNETCKFETNGYEWIISDSGRKYYCSNNVQLEIPANSELFNPGHHIIRSVPTKSARF